MNISFKKFAVTELIILAVAFGVMCLRGLFTCEGTAEVFGVISDGLFVAGGIALGVAVLIWISGEGAFDGIGFTTKTLLSLKWSVFGDFRKNYMDYKEEKKHKPFPKELALCGVLTVVLAVAALAGYYKV